MVDNASLRTMIRDRERGDSPDWRPGDCDRCSREDILVLGVDHPEYDALCLGCCTTVADSNDLATLVAGGRSR